MGPASLLLLSLLSFSLSTFLLLHDFEHCRTTPRDRKSRRVAYGSPAKEWQEPQQVEKVSGEDNVGGGMGILSLDKLRILLGGPESRNAGKSSSYSPAPSPLPHPTAMYNPFHSPGLLPLPQEGRVSGSGNRAKTGRILMAVLLSTATTFVVACLGGASILRRSRRRRRAKRRAETMRVSKAWVGATNAINPPPPQNHRPFYSPSSNCGSIKCECDRGAGSFPAKEACDEEPATWDEVDGPGCFHFVRNSRSSTERSSEASEVSIHVVLEALPSSRSPKRSVSTSQACREEVPGDHVEQSPSPDSRKEASVSPHRGSHSLNPSQREKVLVLSNDGSTDSEAFLGKQSANVPSPPPLPPLSPPPYKAAGSKFFGPPPPLPPLPALLVRPPSQPPPTIGAGKGTNSGQRPPSPAQTSPVMRMRKEGSSGQTPPSPPQPSPITRMRKETSSGQAPPSSPSQSSPMTGMVKGITSFQPPLTPPSPQTPKWAGRDVCPLPKLKPLHWDKVRAAPNQTMVWNKIRSSSFELDEEMMKSLFGYNAQIWPKNEDVGSTSKNTYQFKLVLEPQRLRNFTILLKAVNATPDQVCEALSQGSGLSSQQLEVLVKMVPTKEEELKLLNYDGDAKELDPTERFLASILRIPCSFLKIEVMLFAETFDDEVSQTRKSFHMLEEACNELRSSRLFLKLLEAVLRTGNRMNAGTMRGDARAFRLDALLKLADVKGTDGKTTLLHFIVKEVSRSERASSPPVDASAKKANQTEAESYRSAGLELVAALNGELCNVRKTAGFDSRNLAASISNLSDGMGKLKRLVDEELLPVEDTDGRFARTMNDFRARCERTIEDLKMEERRIMQKVRDTTVYFHGDMSKDELDQLGIFVIVRDFLCSLEQTCKEIGSSKKSLSPNCPAKRVLF